MRVTSGGPSGPPARMTSKDIQDMDVEELREHIAFLRGQRSMVPGSSKGGQRATTVAKKKESTAIEEDI